MKKFASITTGLLASAAILCISLPASANPFQVEVAAGYPYQASAPAYAQPAPAYGPPRYLAYAGQEEAWRRREWERHQWYQHEREREWREHIYREEMRDHEYHDHGRDRW